jgi:hypothetical protein
MPATVELVDAAVVIAPGATASAVLRIRNTGRIVDEFSIRPVGEFAAWMAAPAALPLFPDAVGEVRVQFALPRGSLPAAGTYPFAVQVRSREDAAFSYVAEGRVQVSPVLEVTARLTPRTTSGGRLSRSGSPRLELDNAGNVPATIDLSGGDPDERLTIQPEQARVVVPAGGSAVVRIKVTARKQMLQGTPVTIPFQVVAAPAGAAPISLDGSLSQKALLPSGLGQLLIAIVPLLVVAFIAKTVIDNVSKAAPSPSLAAIASATPAPTPSPSPSPSLVASAAPPSASASPAGPPADATFRGLGLFDPAGLDNPKATFGIAVDGAGAIDIRLLVASSSVKACVQQQGHSATCKTGATGLDLKKAVTAAGAWTITLGGATNGASATVDVEMTWPSATPSLEMSGIAFAGSSAKTGIDLTVVATASGALSLNASWAARPDPGTSNVSGSSASSYDLRFLNVAQPGTPITGSGEAVQNATAPANFMLPPNAYELTLTSRLATSDLLLDGTVSWP